MENWKSSYKTMNKDKDGTKRYFSSFLSPDEAYACWRFDFYNKGYGTYRTIDRDVENGKLTPFQDYPDLSK